MKSRKFLQTWLIKVEEYREKLIETAVEQDEDLMMEYLEEGEEPSMEDIKRCIRKGTRALDFFPTYCGSAFKNKGIQLVLDAVVDYLPSPTEVDPQPLTDKETGEPTGEVATVDLQTSHYVHLRLRSWMTASAP